MPALRQPIAVVLIGLALFFLHHAIVSAAPPDRLADDQAALARQFDDLQKLAKRIAEVIEQDEPERAEQLRDAIRKSQELSLADRFDSIVGLLEQEQLAAAARDQTALAQQLETLLALLLADPGEARREAERERLEAALAELRRMARQQWELRLETLDAEALDEPIDKQSQLEADAESLIENLQQGDPQSSETQQGQPDQGPPQQGPPQQGQPQQGQPQQGQPQQGQPQQGQPQQGQPQQGQPQQGQPQQGQPQQGQPQQGQPQQSADPSEAQEKSPTEQALDRLKAAKQAMQRAIEQLQQAEREGAEQEQADAERALVDAQQAIEEALRQLREEEAIRRLAKLATRLRRMLAEQVDIYELTKQTDADREARGVRSTQIAARGLSARERELTLIADGALRLLEEDGQSLAFPEIVIQLRDDTREVAERLTNAKIGAVTQRLEEEIIASLDETIEALDKTLEEMEQQRQNGGQQQSGQQGDPPVVDKLAELRMIRMLQAHTLRRTKLWSDRLAAGEVDRDEAKTALDRLAARQARLMQAARSLAE